MESKEKTTARRRLSKNLTLGPQIRAKTEAYCSENGRTFSSVVEEALEAFFYLKNATKDGTAQALAKDMIGAQIREMDLEEMALAAVKALIDQQFLMRDSIKRAALKGETLKDPILKMAEETLRRRRKTQPATDG